MMGLKENYERLSDVNMIVSGGLMESAGSLRRILYAVRGLLEQDIHDFLERTSNDLFRRALDTEDAASRYRQMSRDMERAVSGQMELQFGQTEYAMATGEEPSGD
jgi:hypothetical protein